MYISSDILPKSDYTMETRANRASFWECVGKPIHSNDSGEILRQIGLDWEPLVLPARIRHMGKEIISQNYGMLINSKTGQDLTPCALSWKPFGNLDFLNTIQQFLESIGSRVARGGYNHGSKASPRNGDRCAYFVSDEIPELGFSLFNDDVEEKHSSRLFFYNPHCPGYSAGIVIVAIRKICTNGMVDVGIKNQLKQPHTAQGIRRYKKEPALIVLQYKELMKRRREQLEELAKVRVSDSDALEHFIGLAGDNSKEVDEQPIPVKTMQAIYSGYAAQAISDRGINLSLNDYTDHTAYGVVQAVTAYYSHFRGSGAHNFDALKSQAFTDGVTGTAKILNSLSLAYLPQHLRNKQISAQAQAIK